VINVKARALKGALSWWLCARSGFV